MGTNLARQLIADHLVEGEMRPGEEIALKIDQFLTHDMCGPLCALQLEAIGVEEISGDIAVAYCDHLLIQADSKNADDHILLQSATRRFGMWFSRPGNGTSHPVTRDDLGFVFHRKLIMQRSTNRAACFAMKSAHRRKLGARRQWRRRRRPT